MAEKNINRVKLENCLDFTCKNLLLPTIRKRYIEHPLYDKDSPSFLKFCMKVCNVKKNKEADEVISDSTVIKYFNMTKFFKMEKHIKFADENCDELDISAVFEIASVMWLELKDPYSLAFRNEFVIIKDIKDIRNKLSHNDPTSYKKLYKELHLQVSKLKIYASIGNNDILKELENVWNESMLSYIEREPSFIDDFLASARGELCKRYESWNLNKHVPTFLFDKDMPLDDIFTPVAITVDGIPLKEYSELLTIKLRKRETLPSAIILGGHAGYGKTTICKKITYDWCSNQGKLSHDFDLLLHIEIRKAVETNLLEYLRLILLPETSDPKKYSKQEICLLLRQVNILFVLDGYDERSKSASNLITDILTTFPEKRLLITSRPSQVREIYDKLNAYNIMFKNAQIEGFSATNAEEFLDRLYTKMREDETGCAKDPKTFEKFLVELNPALGDLVKMPLMYTLLLYLWKKAKKDERPLTKATFTCVYEQVFKQMGEQIVPKLDLIEYSSSKSKLLEITVYALAEYCYDKLPDMTLILRSEAITFIMEKVKQAGVQIAEEDLLTKVLSGFLDLTPNIRQKTKPESILHEGSRYIFEFHHKTQFEYIIALHLVKCCRYSIAPFENVKHLLLNDKETFLSILGFTLGLLNSDKTLTIWRKHAKDILRLADDTYHENDWNGLFKLLWESQLSMSFDDEVFNENVKDFVEKKVPTGTWKLDDENVVSGLRLLLYLPELKVSEMDINISKPSREINHFLNAWSRLKKPLNGRWKATVFLHLNGDFESRELEMKDHSGLFLEGLKKFGELNKFTGFISGGKEIMEYFDGHSNIQDIGVKVKSLEDLAYFVSSIRYPKRIKRKFWLLVDFNMKGYSKKDFKNKQLSLDRYESAELNVMFDSVTTEDFIWIIQTLELLKPK